MRLRSVPEIVEAVILYGDILPDWHQQVVHPMTRAMLSDLHTACLPFFDQIATAGSHRLSMVGAQWVQAACKSLAKYLPEPEQDNKNKARATPPANDNQDPSYKFGDEAEEPSKDQLIPPLDAPAPPALFNSPSPADWAQESLLQRALGRQNQSHPAGEQRPIDSAEMEALQRFASTIEKASGQEKQWQDMRSDLVEQAIRMSGFSQGPIEGNPADSHEVTVSLGEDQTGGGEIYDRTVELSEDLPAYEKLLQESQPITDALRRSLYPNIEELPEPECARMLVARLRVPVRLDGDECRNKLGLRAPDRLGIN